MQCHVAAAVLLALLCVVPLCDGVQPAYCRRGQSCWPSQQDLETLAASLDPNAKRSLVWLGLPHPRVSAVPINSQGDQPLYGAGVALKPLYVQQDSDRSTQCFVNQHYPEYCLVSVRNFPREKWSPAFVAWPVNAQQIQTLVTFATSHNLAVCVAGTGHDFLNRHSCDQGLFIRTSLMKNITFDDASNAAWVDAGLTFSEMQAAAASHQRYFASGWATTVGIVGWSLGGGHGPVAGSAGLGVDNVLGADIVLANGTLVHASPSEHSDLYWALRGGGGSTWGVVTRLLVRTHPNPKGGFTAAIVVWEGAELFTPGLYKSLLQKHAAWSLTLDKKWSGLTYVTPSYNSTLSTITWRIMSYYVYLGSANSPEFTKIWGQKLSHAPAGYQQTTSFPVWYDFFAYKGLEPIIPVYHEPKEGGGGGVPSVLVSREVVQNGEWVEAIMAGTQDCKTERCSRFETYQCITGQTDSPQDPNVSTSPGMRSAIYHMVVVTKNIEPFYNLGNYSYFSESAYSIDNWQTRLWGDDNYQKLLAIKQRYDPNNVFWCRHCIGSE